MEVALRSDIIQDCDIQILLASYSRNPTITIINLYNDKNHQNNRATKLIRRLPLISNQPTIITGNWNMHHILWANQDQVQHEQKTIEIVE